MNAQLALPAAGNTAGLTCGYVIARARHFLDKNRDGIISASELHGVLKTMLNTRGNMSDTEIRSLIESIDKDGDGRIDLDDIAFLKEKIQAKELDDDDLAIDLLEELEDEEEEEQLQLAKQRLEALEALEKEKQDFRAKLLKQKKEI